MDSWIPGAAALDSKYSLPRVVALSSLRGHPHTALVPATRMDTGGTGRTPSEGAREPGGGPLFKGQPGVWMVQGLSGMVSTWDWIGLGLGGKLSPVDYIQ